LAKQKRVTRKSSDGDSNGSQIQGPLLTSEIKFDRQIDIPNPKLQPNGSLTYTLFDTSSNGNVSPSAIKNNAYFPELEKLSRKLNKTFKKKGTKYLLKKQKELNDTSVQISIALANEGVFLTYTKPDVEKPQQQKIKSI
jgi:hypothetical protein